MEEKTVMYELFKDYSLYNSKICGMGDTEARESAYFDSTLYITEKAEKITDLIKSRDLNKSLNGIHLLDKFLFMHINKGLLSLIKNGDSSYSEDDKSYFKNVAYSYSKNDKPSVYMEIMEILGVSDFLNNIEKTNVKLFDKLKSIINEPKKRFGEDLNKKEDVVDLGRDCIQ